MSFRRIIALPFSQATLASAAKSRKSESRGSSAKKQKTVPGSVVPHRVFENQNLNEMGGSHAFLRRISGMITPECVSRIGDNWYAATKRSALGSILRGTVKVQNIDGYCEIYDRFRIVEPKAEDDILCRCMCTSSHAALNHRERVGAIVARLFEQTTDMERNSSKPRCSELKAIMAKDHPALQELFKLNAREQLSPVLCLALFKDS